MKNPKTGDAAAALRTKRDEITLLVDALKVDAQAIRGKISQLSHRRAALIDAPMSKSEFIRAVCQWVDKKADEGAQRLASGVVGNNNLRSCGAALVRTTQGEGVRIFGILTNGTPGLATVLTDEAVFLFLRDDIKQALTGPVSERITWPYTSTIDDVDAALAEVEAIDNELEKINAELVGLVELGESYGATI